MIVLNPSPSYAKKMQQQDDRFSLKKVFASLAGLPRVLRLVWEASPFLTLAMAFSTLFSSFVPLANVVLTGLLIDSAIRAIAQGTLLPILPLIIAQALVNLLDRLFTTIHAHVQPLLQDRVSTHNQLQILRKADTLDLAFFEDPEYYDTLRQASQEAANRPVMMISQTFDLIRTSITLFSMLGLLLHLQWWLALVALIIPIPSFIASSRYGLKNYWLLRLQSPEKRQQLYLNSIMTVDEFTKEVKLFNLGHYLINRYRQLADKFYTENKRLQGARNRNNFLWSALTVITNSLIYLFIAFEAIQRIISLGDLSRYTLAMTQAGQNVQDILNSLSGMYENSLYVDTLFTFLRYEPKIVAPEHPGSIVLPKGKNGLEIEFRNVSFTYPGKSEPTLKGVSFKVQPGETIALVGRNGAGKTTLVKLLSRLYDPTEGEILIGGHNIKEYDPHELREHIGVIFQDYVQYNMNVQENIGIGRVDHIEDRALAEVAAQKSGADEVIARLDDGYEAMLGRWFDSGVQLSGGEWQKIGLARAFMRDAPLLILDEPTSALDAQAEYDVFTRFRHLTAGKTAIFISHRFSTVRLADRIFMLENGGIIEHGSHEELMSLQGRYAELFNLQAEAYR